VLGSTAPASASTSASAAPIPSGASRCAPRS